MLPLLILGPPPALKAVKIPDARSEIKVRYPTFRGTPGAALATRTGRQYVDEMIAEFRETVKEAAGPGTKTALDLTIAPGRNDPKIVSFALLGYSDWGGPYPRELARGVNVMVVNGKPSVMPNVAELFRPGTPWKKWVIAAVDRERARRKAPPLGKSDIPDYLGREDWSLTRSALRFHFPKGTLGPGVLGNDSVTIPASTFRAALRPLYKGLF